MEMSASTRPGLIQKRVLIQASAATVFQALIDPKELVHWLCDRAALGPETGGLLEAQWIQGGHRRTGRARITRLVSDSMVELLWIDDGQDPSDGKEAHHSLSFTINKKKTNCEVVMRDDDQSVPDEETLALLDEGWNSVLFELKDHCERKERSQKRKAAPAW